MAEEPVEEPLVVEAEPVMAEAPLFAEEEPVVAAEESFYAVEPSPFMADAEEPVVAEQDEPWFVADVQEPAPAPESPAKSDTWSGRSIGSLPRPRATLRERRGSSPALCVSRLRARRFQNQTSVHTVRSSARKVTKVKSTRPPNTTSRRRTRGLPGQPHGQDDP